MMCARVRVQRCSKYPLVPIDKKRSFFLLVLTMAFNDAVAQLTRARWESENHKHMIFTGSALGEIISSNFERDYLTDSSAVRQSIQCCLYGTNFGCDNILQLLAGEAFGILIIRDTCSVHATTVVPVVPTHIIHHHHHPPMIIRGSVAGYHTGNR